MLNIPQSQNCARCEKDLKDLGREYARIFVLGHYLFLVAHRFPRASLSENCSLLGQISEHISVPNGGYCLKVVNITDCLILILKVVRLIVTIISISISISISIIYYYYYYYYYYNDIFISSKV